MLEQYWALKREVPEALLFYRLGDFYELFFEDAETAAPLLGLVLTARHRDSDIEAPMCGVPHHALDGYVGKLTARGFKVAIAEQTELPGRGKPLVSRRIVRVITPGTVVDPERLDASRANELAGLATGKDGIAVAFLDVSTGEFSVVPLGSGDPAEIFGRRGPAEVVAVPSDEAAVKAWLSGLSPVPTLSVLPENSPRGRAAVELLERHFRVLHLTAFGVPGEGALADAAAALLHYAKTTQQSDCAHVASLRVEGFAEGLVVDSVTAGHLELFRSARDGSRNGTLLSVLDKTGTAFGARSLRRMLERPLGSHEEIEARLGAVEYLLSDATRLEALGRVLSGVPDLPRLLARLSIGGGGPRDLLLLARGLVRAAEVGTVLSEPLPALFAEGGEASAAGMPLEMARRILDLLVDEPPAAAKEGGLLREGRDAAVDELRRLRGDSAGILAKLEAGERASRSIPTLRVKFTNVSGHLFEVPASARARIPEDALKRQTLSNAERYATPALLDVDEKLRDADARLAEREAEVFRTLVDETIADSGSILAAAARLGRLDALASLARVARGFGWTRPALVTEPVLRVSAGRHPVVEAVRRHEPFVPNDTDLGQEARLVVLTGPNMGGKSTYLRQNALLVILAHVGSFVPASSAVVGLTDRVFTRVGASDNLARGESTFLVEMAETAHILRQATERSLVVLDEVGRGTSTFDGLSLAWAIAERLHDGEHGDGHGPARVLFATHYHELTELALVRPGVTNRTMAVKEWQGEVVFVRKVVEGAADRSYGVQVARLAGIPEPVLERAREILANLEKQQLDMGGRPRIAEHVVEEARDASSGSRRVAQLPLFEELHAPGELVLDAIRKLEIEQTTPLAALNLIAMFQHRLRGDE